MSNKVYCCNCAHCGRNFTIYIEDGPPTASKLCWKFKKDSDSWYARQADLGDCAELNANNDCEGWQSYDDAQKESEERKQTELHKQILEKLATDKRLMKRLGVDDSLF